MSMTPEYPQSQNQIEVNRELIDTTAARTCQIIQDILRVTRKDKHEHAALLGWTFDNNGTSVTGTTESKIIKGERDHIPTELLYTSNVPDEGATAVLIHSHPNAKPGESQGDVGWITKSAIGFSVYRTPTHEIRGPMPVFIIATPQEPGVSAVLIISQIPGKEKIDTSLLKAALNKDVTAKGVRIARSMLSMISVNPVEIEDSGLAIAQFELYRNQGIQEVNNYLKKALPSKYRKTPPSFKPDFSFLRE